jgi:LuxR family maltose regulon positive regulatory protein
MVLAERGRIDEAHAVALRPVEGPEFHLATCFRACVQLRARNPTATLETIDGIPADRLFPHVSGVGHALRAQALLETGDRRGAHAALEQALDTAQRFGFLEPFSLVGTVLTPLLTEHLRTGTHHEEMVDRVLTHLRGAPPAINEWGDSLTQRERTMLRYLATDMSVSEIAAAEFISTNTVKTHVTHLFRKLAVANRRAAVREAARLGLL